MGLKTDRIELPFRLRRTWIRRKALREFLVASLDGYGDSLTWVDFATRGRAQMMIGEDIMPQRRAPALRAGLAKSRSRPRGRTLPQFSEARKLIR